MKTLKSEKIKDIPSISVINLKQEQRNFHYEKQANYLHADITQIGCVTLK